ncbi:MAG: twin-arginine translocase TatA/TatE family subunit [Endozoicomonadaceae bacterium]|nr:twin-arginine translocase TatA/TatE family subunit [Endozoicomonadaceae bacterium]MBE8232521.1 twin-arginine translocase TatA/TatE family subunit [Endozoicomonadaceae bacterium]
MGLGGISIWQLLIIFLIIVMLFGTRRLKQLGRDLGDAVYGFKQKMQQNESVDLQHDSVEKKTIQRDSTSDLT